MPLARTNMRGWRLKSRLAVNGIQWRSSCSAVISMRVSCVACSLFELRAPLPAPSTEGGSDLLRGRAQSRHEFDRAHQRQARRGRLHRNRRDHFLARIAYRNCDAAHAEHVFLVVDRVTDT